MRYSDTIEKARIVRDVQSCTTTGDPGYSGTAVEVSDETGEELFHIVVDLKGEQQVLFFPNRDGYRIPLDVMIRLLAQAKSVVNVVTEGEG